MHILLRYYKTPGDTREEKVVKTLETMGTSIILGGFTTLLGVLPLAFSTTAVFMAIFMFTDIFQCVISVLILLLRITLTIVVFSLFSLKTV